MRKIWDTISYGGRDHVITHGQDNRLAEHWKIVDKETMDWYRGLELARNKEFTGELEEVNYDGEDPMYPQVASSYHPKPWWEKKLNEVWKKVEATKTKTKSLMNTLGNVILWTWGIVGTTIVAANIDWSKIWNQNQPNYQRETQQRVNNLLKTYTVEKWDTSFSICKKIIKHPNPSGCSKELWSLINPWDIITY